VLPNRRGRQKGLLRPEVGRISRDIRGADARAPRRVSAGAARRRRRRRTRRRSCRSCRRTPLREAGREVSARRARALARVFSESASRDPRGRRRRASPRTHRARRRRSSTRRPPRRIARDGRPSRASSRRRERSSRGVRARAARATRFCFRASRSRERLGGGGKGGGVMCGDAHAGVGDRAARPSRVLRYRGAKRRERGRARVHRAARSARARSAAAPNDEETLFIGAADTVYECDPRSDASAPLGVAAPVLNLNVSNRTPGVQNLGFGK